MLQHTVRIHNSPWLKHPSDSDYSSKKPKTIGLKSWKWLRLEVGACGISWSPLEKAWNLQSWSTEKSHSLWVPFFGLGIFKGCYTILWNHTCNEFQFFQNFQDKPRNIIHKDISSTTLLVFFLKQTTDRQIDFLFWVLRYPNHCTGLEFLLEPAQNKICYRLHPKYTSFFCFLIVCSSAIWKLLF